MEMTVDECMRGEKVVSLLRRLEPLHRALATARWTMRVLGAIIQISAFVDVQPLEADYAEPRRSFAACRSRILEIGDAMLGRRGELHPVNTGRGDVRPYLAEQMRSGGRGREIETAMR
jgi:hypothetical protein